MIVQTRVAGVDVVTRQYRRIAALAPAIMGKALETYLDMLIAWIRTNEDSLFNPKQEEDPNDTTGGMTLAESLWGDAAQVSGDEATIEGGWGVMHGRIMEFGPRDKGPKKIVPKNVKTDGSPIRALRWKSGRGVVYRRSSTYRWKRSMLRPHWRKAIAAKRGLLARIMRTMIRETTRGF